MDKIINNKTSAIINKMGKNFVIAIAFLIAISLGGYIFSHYHTSLQKSTGTLINISGQQRMLTQRIGFLTEELILTSDITKKESIISELNLLINRFKHHHNGLIDGDNSLGLLPVSRLQVMNIYYNSPHYLDDQVRNFIQHVNRLIESSRQETSDSIIEAKFIISTVLNNELLNGLELVVAENEEISNEQMELLNLVNIIVLISNILGLLLVGIFLFRPLLKEVSKQFDYAIQQNKILSDEIKNRKLIESEKEKLEVRYESIINNLPIGVFRLKLGKIPKIITWNKYFLKLLGTTKEKIESKDATFIDYLKNDDTKKLFTDIQNKLTPQKLSDVEMINEKGLESWMNIGGKVIKENNELFFDGSLDNVSETHKIHELLENSYSRLKKADLMKDDIIGITSHELRTPLTIIKGFASILQDTNIGDLNSSQNKYVDKIVTNTDKLLKMINDMLDLSKLEAGKTEFNPEEIDVRSFIMDIYGDFVHQLKSEEKTLLVNIPDEKIIIEYDLDQLKRVMINLLGNSRKFVDPGKGEIELKVEYVGKKQLLFTVKDNGQGIDKDDINNVFVKFKQVGGHMERASKGTGIGLSLVKSILEQMGSQIGVTSSVGVGSEFSFKLNIKK